MVAVVEVPRIVNKPLPLPPGWRLFLRLCLPAFLFVTSASISSLAYAACDADGVECLPETVVADGAVVSRQYDLDFRTDNQSMRGEGEATADQNKVEFTNLVLLERSNTGFDADLDINRIYGFCLDDKLEDMLDGVDLYGVSFSRVINKLKDWFRNRCYKFGADFDTEIGGDFGLSAFGSYAEGSVGLRHPVSIGITHPEQTQFNPGDAILIETSVAARSGANVISHSPSAEFGVHVSGMLDTHAITKSCNFSSCKEKQLWNLDVVGKRRVVLVDGEPGAMIDLSDTGLPIDVVSFLTGFSGTFSVPRITIKNEALDAGLTLSGSDTDRFIHLVVDVDHWLLFALAKIENATKYFGKAKQYAFKAVNFVFTLIDIKTSIDVTKRQEFTFDPKFKLKFSFSSEVEWEVLEGASPVDSDKSASVTLIAGQALKIQTSDAILPLTVSAEAKLPNTFNNLERYEISTYTNIRMLDINIQTPKVTVFGRRCVDFWVGKICSGRFRWPGYDVDYGPVVNGENLWPVSGFLPTVFNGNWELKGFQTFPLQSFEVKANSAPVVTTPLVDQNVQWDQFVDIDLNAHFNDPDGQALSYAVYGRPGFLSMSNGRLYGVVSHDFSGEITVRAYDGFGGETRAAFQLTVFMPLVDEGRLDVAEGGSPHPLSYKLSAQPSASAPVTLRLTPDNAQIDLGAGAGAVKDLIFYDSNWNMPQQVMVAVLDDAIAEQGSTSGVSMEMQSTDTNFQGGGAEKTSIRIRDNDRAGISASPGAVLTGEQASADDNLNIKLTSQPVETVTLAITSSDTTEFSVSPASLDFDAGNWNIPQVVVVTGVQDDVEDGTQNGQIQITSTSTDSFYQGRSRDIIARNTDDDQAGVTITPIVDLRTTEADEGAPDASFRVVLNSEPAPGGVVTVSLQSSDPTEAALSATSAVFNPANWDVPQTVTLTGVDDTDTDGDQTFSIQTGISSVGAPAYALLADADVDDLSATNIDNEQSGLLIAATQPLQTGEDGTGASFTVRLRSRPKADVKVALTSSNNGEGEVDEGELLFTVDDWGVEQQVTLAGVDEDVVDGVQSYMVNLSAASDDLLYAGKTATVQVENQDDDAPALLVSPDSGLEVNEMGASDTFTVVLGKEPASIVTLPVGFSSPISTEAVVSPTVLTFTPENWHQPRTVTVTGINDLTEDGDTLFQVIVGPATSATPYNGQQHIATVTNYDADGAEILLTAQGSLDVSENGGKALFLVQLNTMPLVAIDVSFSLTDGLQGRVSPDVLTFTPENWNVPRIVTFTAQDNAVIDGLRAVELSALVAAGTAFPEGLNSAAFTLNLSDDDVAGVLATPESGLRTDESGGTATFNVVLLAQPAMDVTVPIQSSDPGEGQPDQASLVFTAANWFMPQMVTVTGQDDVMADEDQVYEIQLLPATSADINYDGLDAGDVQASNLDDDEPGVTISATQLTTTEDGDTADFTVVLDTPPESDVQLSISVGDAEEVKLNVQTLTFTAASWNVPQQVVITGQDDDKVDGDQVLTITLSLLASGDDIPSYGSISIPQIEVTNMDNDPVVVMVQEPDTGLTTDESGTEDRFSISLNAQPTENVYMEMHVDDAGEAMLVDDVTDNAVASTTLIFTPEDWDQPREVMVRGVDDAIYDDDQVFNVIIQPTVSVDARFNGIDPADPSGVNGDNDYNPMGYLYHAETGSLVHGGKVAMTCSNGVASVVSGRDGSEGFYQFAVTEINLQANCTLTYTPPAGYMLDDACPPAVGALDVPVTDLPTSLGSSRDDASGKLLDKSCSANTWYQGFNIAVDAARIINNNLPLKRGACTYEPALLQVSGDFAGAGSTILSSAQEIQAADENSPVEVLAPHHLVLKAPRMMVKPGVVFRVEDGASLSVSPVVEYCQ